MRYGWILLLIGSLLIAACDNQDKEDSQSTENTVQQVPVTPTMTPIPFNFTGPILNPIAQEEECKVGDENCIAKGPNASTNALPLPLVEQTYENITISIPEGFIIFSSGKDLYIQAENLDTDEGRFTVQIRYPLDDDAVTAYLQPIADLHVANRYPRHNQDQSLNGFAYPYGDRGQVIVFELGATENLLMQGYARPGYWSIYSATFEQMIDSISLATP